MAARSRSSQNIVRCTCELRLANVARVKDWQGESHEDAICYAHRRDDDRFPRAGATRPIRAATGLPSKRLLQRLPAERVVPHRRVVKFEQLLGNCEGADASSAPSQHYTGRRQLK